MGGDRQRDKTARLWDLSLDEHVEMACRTAGRNLNTDEWNNTWDNPDQKIFVQFADEAQGVEKKK